MSAGIAGLGTALPAVRLDQATALAHAAPRTARDAGEAAKLARIYRGARVDQRHVVLPFDDPGGAPPALDGDGAGAVAWTTAERMAIFAQAAPALAAAAGRAALHDAGLRAEAVTHLVTVSCTGFVAPGVDAALVRDLALPTSVRRTNVGFMGCHGAINALRVARAIVAESPAATVLVVSVELCSLHFARGWHPERVVANALFADGAAAIAVRADGAWRLGDDLSHIVPGTDAAMSWRIGDEGFVMGLATEVPALLAQEVPPAVRAWLGARAVDGWAVHPGGPRILDAVERALSLPADALAESRAVLRSCGNMSSATVLFVLDRLRAASARRRIALLGFGPGLAIEGLLVERAAGSDGESRSDRAEGA